MISAVDPEALRRLQHLPSARTVHDIEDRADSHLVPHDGLLRAACARWAANPGLREDYSKYRPNVERAVVQAATWRGRGSSSATAG